MKFVSREDIPPVRPLTPEQLAAAENDPKFDHLPETRVDIPHTIRDFQSGKWHGFLSLRNRTIDDLKKTDRRRRRPNRGPINMPT